MTLVARRSLGREPGREAEIQWETYRDWTEGQLSALLEEQCGRLVPADKEAERAAAFRFTINPLSTYLYSPLILVCSGLLATIWGTADAGYVKLCQSIKE